MTDISRIPKRLPQINKGDKSPYKNIHSHTLNSLHKRGYPEKDQ